MTKHTPGKWNTLEGKTLLHIETPSDHKDGAGIPICSVPKSKRANARLIASAPELLEHLKSMTDYCARVNPKGEKSIGVIAARAAIAKAEGEA